MIGRAISRIVRNHKRSSAAVASSEQCERWHPRGARGGEGRVKVGGSIRKSRLCSAGLWPAIAHSIEARIAAGTAALQADTIDPPCLFSRADAVIALPEVARYDVVRTMGLGISRRR